MILSLFGPVLVQVAKLAGLLKSLPDIHFYESIKHTVNSGLHMHMVLDMLKKQSNFHRKRKSFTLYFYEDSKAQISVHVSINMTGGEIVTLGTTLSKGFCVKRTIPKSRLGRYCVFQTKNSFLTLPCSWRVGICYIIRNYKTTHSTLASIQELSCSVQKVGVGAEFEPRLHPFTTCLLWDNK